MVKQRFLAPKSFTTKDISKIHRTQVKPETWVRRIGLPCVLGRTDSAVSLSSGQLRKKLGKKREEGLCSPRMNISLMAEVIVSVVEQKKGDPRTLRYSEISQYTMV